MDKLASLMIEPPEILVDDIISWGFDEIPQEILYGEDSRQIDIHVTLINGVKDNFDKVYKNICAEKPFECKMTDLNLFTMNKNYDVLYAEIHSDELVALNHRLKHCLLVETKYKNYIPHITIAYLKKDVGTKYIGNCFLGEQKFNVNSIYYDSKFGVKTLIDMEKK